jgi:hypothetical protein
MPMSALADHSARNPPVLRWRQGIRCNRADRLGPGPKSPYIYPQTGRGLRRVRQSTPSSESREIAAIAAPKHAIRSHGGAVPVITTGDDQPFADGVNSAQVRDGTLARSPASPVCRLGWSP